MRKVMAPEVPFPMPLPAHSLCFAISTLCSWAAPFCSTLGATKHPGMAPQWHFCSRAQVLSVLIPVGQSPMQPWAHPTLCEPELIPTGPFCTSSTGERLDPASSSLCPSPAGLGKEQPSGALPQRGPNPSELLTEQEEEEDGGSIAASGQ